MNPPGISSFNVFASELERIEYHGEPVDFRLLHRSADGRHAVFFSSGAGDGIRFRQRPSNLTEAFYIIEGTITCTRGNGERVVWGAGDLIYWPYDEELDLEYSPGLKSVCFFWSDDELPDFSSVGSLD